MKKGELFWGILLVTLGVLFALRNFDVVFFNWRSVFRLWPLIFIFWGIALLPVQSYIKIILAGLTLLLGVLILVRYPEPPRSWLWWFDRHSREDRDREREEDNVYRDYSWEDQQWSEAYDTAINYARLDLDAAAGKFYIHNETDKLFDFESEGEEVHYDIKAARTSNSVSIDISYDKPRVRKGELTSDVWLALNPNPLWKLNVDVGAAGLDLDLSPFRIEKIDIKGGASKIELKIGDRHTITKVKIDAAVSEIEIKVPFGSACELETSTVFSARDIDGFNKISSSLYQTPNFSDSVNQVFIEINAAVSGLKVNRYE